MLLKKITLEVPSEMVNYLEHYGKKNELQRNALLLYPFIKNNTISHGRVAEIIGISKNELIDIYCNMGIPYLTMDIAEIEDEVETWKKMKEKRKK